MKTLLSVLVLFSMFSANANTIETNAGAKVESNSQVKAADPADKTCGEGIAYRPQEANIVFAGGLIDLKTRFDFCALREKFPMIDGRYYVVSGFRFFDASRVAYVEVQQFYSDGKAPTTKSCEVTLTSHWVPDAATMGRYVTDIAEPVCSPEVILK